MTTGATYRRIKRRYPISTLFCKPSSSRIAFFDIIQPAKTAMSNALKGSIRLDTRKSSSSKIPFPSSSGTKFSNFKSDQTLKDSKAAIPSTHPQLPARIAIFGRENALCSSSQDTTGSNIPITLENAAKNNKIKNKRPTICPPGMLPNATGSVTNIKPGPPAGSRPCENTSGKMTMPANSATAVSASAIVSAAFGRDICLGT